MCPSRRVRTHARRTGRQCRRTVSWSLVFELVTGRHRRVASHQPGARTSGTPWFIRIFQPTMIDESVMEPAEQHTVVGVGRPAVHMLQNMVDFTPAGGNTAAGDDAAAVAEGDRAALVPVEHAFFDAEAQDASIVAERDALDDAGTPDVQRRRHSERHVAALGVRVPLATLGILLAHRHEKGRCGAADRRQQTTGCRDRQCARERVVLLLRPGAEVERDHRVVGFARPRGSPRRSGLLARPGCCARRRSAAAGRRPRA